MLNTVTTIYATHKITAKSVYKNSRRDYAFRTPLSIPIQKKYDWIV